MASSWLIMTASLAFSYATPIKSMSPVRPLKSLFHPGIFISILGQAAIHLFCLVYAVNMAKENMGDKHRMNGQCRDSGGMLLGATTEELCEEASGTWSDNGPCLQEVITFFKKVKAGEEVDPNDEDPLAEIMALWSTPFLPNLMNSTVFLVETAQIIAVLFVNYKGRPWMNGLTENHPLFLSIFACIGGVTFLAFEISPDINHMLHLSVFPNDEFRETTVFLVCMSIVGTFIWDRIVLLIFANEIFMAMWREALKTSLMDCMPIFTSLLKVAVGIVVLGSGNPLVWGGAWYFNKRRVGMMAEWEDQKRMANLEEKKKQKLKNA